MTIYQLATKTGLSWHSISNLENGHGLPRLDSLLWFCRQSGWKLGELIADKGKREESP